MYRGGGAVSDPDYMSRQIQKFRTDKFDTSSKQKFDSCNHGWRIIFKVGMAKDIVKDTGVRCAFGVASTGKCMKCWCGNSKVGVATATPDIRHAPPMHVTHINGWFPVVYMRCMSQNFRLFHVSKFIRPKLLNFSVHVSGVTEEGRVIRSTQRDGPILPRGGDGPSPIRRADFHLSRQRDR